MRTVGPLAGPEHVEDEFERPRVRRADRSAAEADRHDEHHHPEADAEEPDQPFVGGRVENGLLNGVASTWIDRITM